MLLSNLLRKRRKAWLHPMLWRLCTHSNKSASKMGCSWLPSNIWRHICIYAPYRSLSWNDLVAAILVHDCVLYNFALSFLYICSILAFTTHPSSGLNFSPSAFCYRGRRGVQWNAVGGQAAALKIPAPLHRGKSFTAPCSLVGGTCQATYNAFSPQPTKA